MARRVGCKGRRWATSQGKGACWATQQRKWKRRKIRMQLEQRASPAAPVPGLRGAEASPTLWMPR